MSWIKLLLVSIMLIVITVGCGKNTETAWQEQYDLGVQYLNEGKYEEAIQVFTDAIEIDSKRVQAYIGRGDTYSLIEEDGEFSLSIADYEQALELDETCVEAYIGLADIYFYQGDSKKAEKTLEDGYLVTENETLSKRIEDLKKWLSAADVSFERIDHSLYNDDEEVVAEFYYDYATVNGNHLQGRKINADLYKVYMDYVQEVEQLKKEETFDPELEYYYTWFGEQVYNQNGVLSISYGEDWMMGGVHNLIQHGFTYNLKTGERMELKELYDVDAKILLNLIKYKITEEVNNKYSEGLTPNVKATIDEYTLDSFDYYISEEGELVICIPVYELGGAADGSHAISCGIYLNSTENDLKEAMSVKKMYPAEFIGKTVNDVNKYYGKSYFFDVNGGSSCIYYADSPQFLFGEIVDKVKDEQRINMIITNRNDVLLDGLSGEMTYPELVKAVGNKTSLSKPQYYDDYIGVGELYTLSFEYQGLHFTYDWQSDPNTSKSISTWVTK